MKHRSKRRRSDAIVSASELAQMGRCEQLVLFEHRHGQRRLLHQEAARRQGLAAHERFEQEGLAVRSAGLRRAGRCFVASLLFGEAWQTQALRQFRDKVLRPRGTSDLQMRDGALRQARQRPSATRFGDSFA